VLYWSLVKFLHMNPVNSVKQKIGSTTLWLHFCIISYTVCCILNIAPTYSYKLLNRTAGIVQIMKFYWFLGTVTGLREATMSFVMSVCPSVRIKQLGSHWTDFRELWYWSIFPKSVKKIQVSLKSDKNNGYITWRPMYVFDHISLISS